ncbi:CAP domain-containing protein [Methanococcus maripaludis]|uniref:CAP domain-containing protein n=1 Tax=Methanococcus maripaludis TaxID=39152 RepID=UPI0023EA56CE|nr:CAP domain-containing protein [Methanococcus maripaludis]
MAVTSANCGFDGCESTFSNVTYQNFNENYSNLFDNNHNLFFELNSPFKNNMGYKTFEVKAYAPLKKTSSKIDLLESRYVPVTTVDTSEDNTDTSSEDNTDTSSEDNTDTSSEDNTDTSSEDNTDTSSEDNTDTSSEDNTDTSSEDNTDTSSEDNTDTSSEDNTDTSSEDNTDTSSEDNTDTSSEDNTDTSSEDNTDTSSEDYVYLPSKITQSPKTSLYIIKTTPEPVVEEPVVEEPVVEEPVVEEPVVEEPVVEEPVVEEPVVEEPVVEEPVVEEPVVEEPVVEEPVVEEPVVEEPVVEEPVVEEPVVEEPVVYKNAQIEQYILEYTNMERSSYGLEALVLDSALSQISQDHSDDMAENDYFSHVNLDGETPTDRAIAADYNVVKYLGDGYYSTGIGENIAKMPTGNVIGIGYVSDDAESIAKAIVDAWMDSDGHRANILNSQYTNIGIGVAFDGTYYIATQNFY